MVDLGTSADASETFAFAQRKGKRTTKSDVERGSDVQRSFIAASTKGIRSLKICMGHTLVAKLA